MKKLLQVLCLVLGAWMVCSNGWAQGPEMNKPYVATDNGFSFGGSWGNITIPATYFLKGANEVRLRVTGAQQIIFRCNDVEVKKYMLYNGEPLDVTYVVKGDELTAARNGKFSATASTINAVLIVTNVNSNGGGDNGGTTTDPGTNPGTDNPPIVTPSTKTLAEKIAAREQLTNLATIYMTVPDAEGKDINSVVFKDRATNVADYHQTTIQVVENGCNDGTGRTLGNFTEAGLQIKVRGNSTADYNKKPYRLRFYKDQKDAAGNVEESHKHDMLGYGYEKRNWTLLANHKDGTFMQNAITYYIGKAVGMPFCPGYKFVDLVINGEYRGNYQLSDHVELGSNRIDIDESTGWFVESTRNDMVEEPYFNDASLYVLIKSPESKTDAGTAEIKQMIRKYFVNNNNAIFGVNATGCDDKTFCDPFVGWRSVFDEESLVNFYVGLQLTGDSDGMMQVKMYREENGKMHFGPLWDKDLAFGVQDDGKTLAEGNSLEFGAPTFNNYIKKIMRTDPVFVKKVHDKLHDVLDNGYVENIIAEINKIEPTLLESKALEYANCDDERAVSVSAYPEVVEGLRQYIRNHTKWFTDFMDERYVSMGGDNIKIPVIGEVPYTNQVGLSEWKTFPVNRALFRPNASSANITVTGAAAVKFYNTDILVSGNVDNQYLAPNGDFGYKDSNKAGVTLTVSGQLLNDARNGMLYVYVGGGSDIKMTVENVISNIPGTPCTHTYTTDDCTTDADGILHRTCSKCGSEESDVNYYEFTVYPESATSQTVIAKSWTPAADKPNSIALVKITSGLEKNIKGYNIVNSTKNADGDQTCADFRLTDGHPYYSDKKFVAAKATYTRSLGADEEYGMMTLPFKHQDAENADAEFYHIDKVEAGKIYLTAIDPSIEGNASAYLPVIFKRKAGKTSVTVTGTDITVKKTTTTDKFNSTCEGWTIVGAVENASATAAGLYEMSDAKTGTVSNVSSVSIAPYRAYLLTTTSAPQTLTLVLPGGEEEVITLSSLVNAIEKMKTENVTKSDIEAIVNKLLEKE